MLWTGYPLTFGVLHPSTPFLSRGRDVRLSVALKESADPGTDATVERALATFVAFANTGGLAGTSLDPGSSGVTAYNREPSASEELVFRLTRCRIDDRSLVTLCDLLLHDAIAPHVREVVVRSDGQNLIPLGTDFRRLFEAHPGRFEPLPFQVVDEEPESGTCVFTLTLAAPITVTGRAALQSRFDAWCAFVRAGGFALPPIPPAENYVEPDDPLVDFDDIVEWTVFKLRAHPAAIDAIVNIVVAFHATHDRVREFVIS
jgi:hypothetical protein